MKRRKLVTMGVSFLLCVGMVGAGFASWLITSDTTETAEGNIAVEKVTDGRVLFDVATTKTGVTNDGDVYFGAPENAAKEEGDWLISVSDAADGVEDPYEDLEVALFLTLTQDNITTLKGQGIKSIVITPSIEMAKENEGTPTAYGTAINSQYIIEPTEIDIETDEGELNKTNNITNIGLSTDKKSLVIDISGDNVPLEYAVTLNYAWGDAFNGVRKINGVVETDVDNGGENIVINRNPFDYFNDNHKADDDYPVAGDEYADKKYADYALKVLQELEALNEQKFAVKVVGTVSTDTLANLTATA